MALKVGVIGACGRMGRNICAYVSAEEGLELVAAYDKSFTGEAVSYTHLDVYKRQMYFFHVFENVGMNVGIMPIAGIPLPFISYGGSATLANFMGIALLENIYMRRENLSFRE